MTKFLIRIFDFILSLLAIIGLSPLMLIIMIMIIVEDFGNPFFLQWRVGRNKRKFKIFKFRSMYVNLGDKSGVEIKNRDQFQGTQKNDKRITRIGEFIRKTSIDELPQLLNVMLGNMSLIGPRPDTPIQEVDYTKDNWNKRHQVKPGISGMAQINGRSSVTMEDRCNNDNYWVDNYSFGMYIKLIINTITYFINGAKGTN